MSQHEMSCLPIEKLAQRDAVFHARAAVVKGDLHLLMLDGFVGSVPGVESPGSLPTQSLEGTSDTETEACARLRATAETYATKYNRTIMQVIGG